jgi:hypothetical protein
MSGIVTPEQRPIDLGGVVALVSFLLVLVVKTGLLKGIYWSLREGGGYGLDGFMGNLRTKNSHLPPTLRNVDFDPNTTSLTPITNSASLNDLK